MEIKHSSVIKGHDNKITKRLSTLNKAKDELTIGDKNKDLLAKTVYFNTLSQDRDRDNFEDVEDQ